MFQYSWTLSWIHDNFTKELSPLPYLRDKDSDKPLGIAIKVFLNDFLAKGLLVVRLKFQLTRLSKCVSLNNNFFGKSLSI